MEYSKFVRAQWLKYVQKSEKEIPLHLLELRNSPKMFFNQKMHSLQLRNNGMPRYKYNKYCSFEYTTSYIIIICHAFSSRQMHLKCFYLDGKILYVKVLTTLYHLVYHICCFREPIATKMFTAPLWSHQQAGTSMLEQTMVNDNHWLLFYMYLLCFINWIIKFPSPTHIHLSTYQYMHSSSLHYQRHILSTNDKSNFGITSSRLIAAIFYICINISSI